MRFGSPIEQQLFAGLMRAATERKRILQVQEGKTWPVIDASPEEIIVFGQVPLAPYTLDFVVANANYSVAVECDGHRFHERTQEQAEHDKKRDRRIAMTMPTLRFTGREINRNAVSIADEIIDFLDAQTAKFTTAVAKAVAAKLPAGPLGQIECTCRSGDSPCWWHPKEEKPIAAAPPLGDCTCRVGGSYCYQHGVGEQSEQFYQIGLVATRPYGNEGLMPLKCPAYPDNSVSCAGSSGDNFCGGFRGTVERSNRLFVKCGELEVFAGQHETASGPLDGLAPE